VTQAQPSQPAETAETAPPQTHDTFLSVTIRRTRFAAAILLSGFLFWTFGWMVAGPAAPNQAFTLLAWPGSNPVLAALGLLLVLIVAAVASMALTHPDTPHAGFFCALLGLGALAIRGGTIYPLLRLHDTTVGVHDLYWRLAQECVIWAAILFVAELATSRIYARYFYGTAWIERINADEFRPGTEAYKRKHRPRGLLGLALTMAIEMSQEGKEREAKKKKAPPPTPMNRSLANLLALTLACAVASMLLPVFMQSQAKAQVLFAAFVSFAIAGGIANNVFTQSDVWPILLCVPLTAAIGYFRATGKLACPGFSVTSIARALPVDYLAAGAPGALFGYYMSLRELMGESLAAED